MGDDMVVVLLKRCMELIILKGGEMDVCGVRGMMVNTGMLWRSVLCS